jgi:hypothetical protein
MPNNTQARDLLPGLGRAAIGGQRAVSAILEPVRHAEGRRTLAGEGAPSRTLKNSVLAKRNVGSSKVTLA